jgi:hypothetical protein
VRFGDESVCSSLIPLHFCERPIKPGCKKASGGKDRDVVLHEFFWLSPSELHGRGSERFSDDQDAMAHTSNPALGNQELRLINAPVARLMKSCDSFVNGVGPLPYQRQPVRCRPLTSCA